MKKLLYNISSLTYTESQEVAVMDRCNGWIAINTGDDTVTVEGIILLPAAAPGLSGQSVSVGGNLCEEYAGRINIAFAGVGVAPSLQLVQKYYVDIYPD